LKQPLLDEIANLSPGKLWHAASVAVPLLSYDVLSLPNDPESIYPLMSQPVLELCLQLPTYVLIQGGQDRALARRAFAEDLPRQVARRTTKGGSTTIAKTLYEKNLPFIRELLLDGELVRAGYLDRKKLELNLRPGHAILGHAFGEILIEHLSTEAWLRSWSDKPKGVLAA
jgi:asparagine synthase (glutamine-hydrolysing)